ncbi:DUF4097 family beta strand repeat-containing protein [Granulicella arctica]|uniref:DUF4097 and DUF4098 domain-containing protein YvlB n=1 Tax=Granulicella arctica TaxID=940613 RepID=A0A7Y9PDX3_9BACT|nr:DUF4097 family beta strand repeat-containing protein [Granulicella arctica]NYF77910.1 DUF4097 and DUF4098 domain-containing protein YvlB [Granulicella arctica]
MAGNPPPYPPPGPPNGPPYSQDWKYQRRILRDQARAQRDQYRYQRRAMRRGSVLGPLVMVLIGIVFLLNQTGHLNSDSLWQWYAQWWPLLLVGAGLILLIEWGVDQLLPRSPGQPYVRRRVGGGVIILILLLTVAGAIFNGVRDNHDFFSNKVSFIPDNLDEFFGNKHESDQTVVEALPVGGAVTIDNPRGDITISGTSTDNQVHVSVHKAIYSRSDAEAESRARQLSPQIDIKARLLSVALPMLSGAVADVTMTVPPAASVTVNANHGDVHVDSVQAPVTVTANHGDVELSSIAGAVVTHINSSGSSFSAHAISGPVTLEGHGQDLTLSDVKGAASLSGDFYGTTHLEHITSGVKFHTNRTDFQLGRLDGELNVSPENISADQAVGPVVLTTRDKIVTLERISGDLSVTNKNGAVNLTSAPPLGNITVQNRNGSVCLTLPDKANFTVSAETSDGDMDNDFSLPGEQNDSRKTLNGTVGKGGSLIRINTSQGDVSLRKASIAPLPPVAPTPPTPPQVSINSADGSSVYVGKDGVRVISGSDGSSVIVGKDGLHITANADGSSTYKSKDGTKLTEGSDGSKIYSGRDGTHYTQNADGSKTYTGPDGTHISIGADGSQVATGPGGKSLNDTAVKARLREADNLVRQAEQQRDAERRNHRSSSKDDDN